MSKFDPSKTYRGPGIDPYDNERVPMMLLVIGLMIGLVIFLWWAVQ